MTSQFYIEKRGGNVTPGSRRVFKEQFDASPDGWLKITIEESKTGKYTPTRYKYYFGHVLTVILEKCAHRFLIVDHNTGEQRTSRNTSEIHEALKFMYNPVTVITPKGAFTTGGTTTALPDRDFIGEYTEAILADFSLPPYNCDFRDIEDWKEDVKAKHNI